VRFTVATHADRYVIRITRAQDMWPAVMLVNAWCTQTVTKKSTAGQLQTFGLPERGTQKLNGGEIMLSATGRPEAAFMTSVSGHQS